MELTFVGGFLSQKFVLWSIKTLYIVFLNFNFNPKILPITKHNVVPEHEKNHNICNTTFDYS